MGAAPGSHTWPSARLAVGSRLGEELVATGRKHCRGSSSVVGVRPLEAAPLSGSPERLHELLAVAGACATAAPLCGRGGRGHTCKPPLRLFSNQTDPPEGRSLS